jgi:hypothetical protein
VSETRQPWELTDDGIAAALNAEAKVPRPGHHAWTADDITHLDRAIASAAVQKVGQWVEGINVNTCPGNADPQDCLLPIGCYQCWLQYITQALKGVSK